MGLGDYPTIGLADARTRAMDARRLTLDGIDPIEQRKQKRTEAKLELAKRMTFGECASQYITAHKASWKNAKHRQQWENTLKAYAYPTIGTLPVGSIDTSLVMKVLQPIWMEKPETANRLRGRIESVLDWATASGFRPAVPNPARWKGHLDNLLPARHKIAKTENHPALPFDEAPSFTAALHKQEGNAALALEYLVLTVARTGEVIGARWREIDLAEAKWTVPAERMKAGREHVVPLPPRAVAILKKLRPDNPEPDDYVFPGRQSKKPLSNMAFLMLLRRMNHSDITAHGFRSTFRDWAGDCTSFDHQTIEFALAHGISDKTEAAYRRGTAIEKRRKLMQAWANYCASPAVKQKTAKVVGIREAVQ
jgi:integrase